MTYALQNNPKSLSFSPSSLSLQKAIEEGNLQAIQSLLKQDSFANTLLPRKEFPLHAVVRSARLSDPDKIEAIKLLIQSGADFEAKDIHGLTALDHAIHLKNAPLAKAMISEKVGIASEIIQSQIDMKRISDSLADVNERLEKKSAIDSTKLGSFQKAAYEGNDEELKKAVSGGQNELARKHCLDQLDRNGLAPKIGRAHV